MKAFRMTSNKSKEEIKEKSKIERLMFNDTAELMKDHLNVGAALSVLATACFLAVVKHTELLEIAFIIVEFFNLTMAIHALSGIFEFVKKYPLSWRVIYLTFAQIFSLFIQCAVPVVIGVSALKTAYSGLTSLCP
ncbi:hypothetical protein [Microvirgula aerodenitrificans]|uniref:hypothetical protein n=1 Tax=Microvirgula aerodenitrificans TaxID=57480 RepID=UPI0028EDB5C8|nr:hypothetical protein [Microvirgula aerodenitrificans]